MGRDGGDRDSVAVKVRQRFKVLLADRQFSEILTGSAYALSARVVGAGVGMVSSIIVVRYYGAAMMGILAVVNSSLVLAATVGKLGTNVAVLRFIPEHIARYSPTSASAVFRKVQVLVVVASLVIGGVLFLGADVVADEVFRKPQLSFFLAIASGVVVFYALADINTHGLRGLRWIRGFATMQLLPSAMMLTLLVGLTLFARHPANPVYAQLASWVIVGTVGWWVVRRAFACRIGVDDVVHPIGMRDILALSLPLLMTASLQVVIGQSSIIILGIYRSEAEVGYFAVALQLANLTLFALAAINTMAAPKFAELFHASELSELVRVARKVTRLAFWATVPVLLVLAVFGKPILQLVYGEEFGVAYLALLLLVVGQVFNSVSGSTGYFMNMTGHHKTFRNIMAVTAVAHVTMSLVGVRLWGIYGAAGASAVSLVLWNLWALWFIKKHYGRSIGYLPVLSKE